jgi:signal transduction histidine kinase
MAAWAVGRALSERGRRAAELEVRADRLQREHESAVAEERARIARELHDVIAHSVSVMTVQAGAARLLLDGDPERARDSLLSLENTGRQALADMRRLLGILRSDHERAALRPQPGIGDVPALVDQMRAAGLRADLSIEGEPKPLAPGVDLTAYRIVQEALTNALKHAAPAPARVAVRYARDTLAVEVVNDGPLRGNGRPGHGLVGMRERVGLYGGTLTAGPTDEGGFRVHAELPVDPAES